MVKRERGGRVSKEQIKKITGFVESNVRELALNLAEGKYGDPLKLILGEVDKSGSPKDLIEPMQAINDFYKQLVAYLSGKDNDEQPYSTDVVKIGDGFLRESTDILLRAAEFLKIITEKKTKKTKIFMVE